ncbi:MAG: efflux RND transporter permease subunit [Deltaproteobacteria bacterium]|nr:MAG: efflux RND transporter permease subunit [Deltaproteobacteria bacterium]
MRLPETSVKRPVLTLMVFAGILIFGLMSFYSLPVDIFPDITLPAMVVVTKYPGGGPEDVEAIVTKNLEKLVSTVPNLEDISSISMEEYSVISLRFGWGTNLDDAAANVRDVVGYAKRFLPDDVEDSVVMKFDTSMMPILYYGVTAKESYIKLNKILQDEIADPLKRVPGVALVDIFGGLKRQIRVDIDRDKLNAYHIPINNVVMAIMASNIGYPAGNVKIGKTDYTLRVPGEFKSVDEIENIAVGSKGGVPIYLRDVADVFDGFEEKERVMRVNRESGAIMIVQKQSGANTLEVIERVKARLEELKQRIPGDIKLHVLMDSSEFINLAIGHLYDAMLWGGFFIILVIFLFLRNLRGSMIVVLAIPFSLIVGFIFLYAGGYTINMMSLASLSIAIGMVVDDAIVVFENIFRHRERGISPQESALFGASQVGLAVTAATFTIIAVVLPIIFVPGITGVLFKELGMVVCLTMLASLFVSLTLTPMLSSRILVIEKDKAGIIGGLYRRSEQWFQEIELSYSALLGWGLTHRKAVIVIGMAIFAVSLAMIPLVGTEYMPEMDQGRVMGDIELPLGTKIEKTDEVLAKVEKIMDEEVKEKRMIFARAGRSESGFFAAMGEREDVNLMMVGSSLVKIRERERSDREIAHIVSKKIGEIPGIRSINFDTTDPMAEMIFGGDKPITLEVYGEDFDKTDIIAEKLREMLEKIPGTTDISISRERGKPELWVRVDREKAASLGLNMAMIADTLKTNFSGKVASRFQEGGEEYDIFVRLREEDRSKIEDIENILIPSPLRAVPLPSELPIKLSDVPLGNIARIEKTKGPIEIERKSQGRVVKVGAGLYDRNLGEVVRDVNKELKNIPIPEGVEVILGGAAEEQVESFRILTIALVLGILLVYMVMAGQFESLLGPLIILFSVPFAITGVIWALLLTGNTLSLISFVGMIMLVGIVVRNAIVLVDYTNILRGRGLPMSDAIREAGATRLRPVLMTAFSTALGMLPLALMRGEGANMWNPLGISVIGGLLVSTLITLLFIPTLYSIVEGRSREIA